MRSCRSVSRELVPTIDEDATTPRDLVVRRPAVCDVGPGEPPRVALSVVDEVDGYIRSVTGVEVEAVPTGLGTGPNRVLTVQDERLLCTSSEIGCPMRTRTTIGDDRVVLGYVLAAPAGSRWCEFDLRPGTVVTYGPGAEHTGISLPGLHFQFVTIEVGRLADHADQLESPIEMPHPGEVQDLTLSPTVRDVLPSLSELVAAASNAAPFLHTKSDAFLDATVRTLSGTDRLDPTRASRRIDSRHVIHQCIDYADSVERIPSISELCLAAHVSERRLRKAFTDEYDLPPTRFFRSWALARARQRLTAEHNDRPRVTDIAFDLGFGHLGRFAAQYRELYGESPSTTLEYAARSSAAPGQQ